MASRLESCYPFRLFFRLRTFQCRAAGTRAENVLLRLCGALWRYVVLAFSGCSIRAGTILRVTDQGGAGWGFVCGKLRARDRPGWV